MNRSLREKLADAERHVAEGDIRLERLRKTVDERRRAGLRMREAEHLLQNMENLQRMCIQHLEQIRRELEQMRQRLEQLGQELSKLS